MDRSKLYSYSDGSKYQNKSAEEIFSDISENNVWLDNESISGSGSNLKQTKVIIDKLPKLFAELNIKTIFYIPCGDFNWFKMMDLSNIKYLGGDIVKNIVERNKHKYSNDKISFIHHDLLKDMINKFDLIFCRDCLVHFSFSDIYKSINNIIRSRSKYFITTTFREERENKDIITGGWRPINLELAPFNFPKPIYLINEECTEMKETFSDKSLGVWQISDLSIMLLSNK